MNDIKDWIDKKKKDGVHFKITVDIRKVENFFKKLFGGGKKKRERKNGKKRKKKNF